MLRLALERISMQVSFLSSFCGTPAENYKDKLVQLIKKMVAEGKPINWDTLEKAIAQHNQANKDSRILTQKELVSGEFYQLVTAAIWKGIQECELKLALPE